MASTNKTTTGESFFRHNGDFHSSFLFVFCFIERRWSLIILFLAILLILLITAAGLCVHFLVEGNLSKILLLALIGLLVLVGALSFAFLECIRRAELKRGEQVIVINEQRQKIFPTAPEISDQTSWAYSTPWRYTKGSTTAKT